MNWEPVAVGEVLARLVFAAVVVGWSVVEVVVDGAPVVAEVLVDEVAEVELVAPALSANSYGRRVHAARRSRRVGAR